MRISIRAPARGATTVSVCAEFSGSNFNPRSREGSDIDWVSNPLCNAISIRTPARGATRTWTRLPRLCRFQSALPRGERHLRRKVPGHVTDFNPRSREGSDRIHTAVFSICNTISIRAPARGATQYQGGANAWIEFQSALPRGERPDISSEIHKAFLISIRAPARGATLLHAGTAYQWCISIRAPARGATITSNRSVRLIRISIRAPARGATCTFTHILSIRQFQSALPRGERPRDP